MPGRSTHVRRFVRTVVGAAVALSILGPTPAALAAVTMPTARDLEFRAEFGLSTNRSAVALAIAGRAPSPNWGVRLTDAEEADLANRVRIEDQLTNLRASIEANPGFGGLFIDQKAGGVIDIATTPGTQGAIRGSAAALAPIGAKIQVRVVPNSMSTLQHLKLELRTELLNRTALGRQINTLRVDVKSNIVVVGVDRSSYAATVQGFTRQFAGRPISFEPADRSEPAACTFRDDVCLPLRAGIAVNVGGQVCTSNAVVSSGSSYYLMTAGHCGHNDNGGRVGDTVIHHGLSIGTIAKTAFHNNTFADAEMVGIPSTRKSNLVYVTSAVQRAMTSRMALNGDVVGSPVCGSGIITEFFCGTVTDTDIDGQVGPNAVLSMQLCTVDVRQGDSGGPMFYGTKYMGIISNVSGQSHVGSDGRMWWENLEFSQIRDAEIQLGVSTYLG